MDRNLVEMEQQLTDSKLSLESLGENYQKTVEFNTELVSKYDQLYNSTRLRLINHLISPLDKLRSRSR